MKALVCTFNQEKALVWAFSVIVQPVVEPMEHYTALVSTLHSPHLNLTTMHVSTHGTYNIYVLSLGRHRPKSKFLLSYVTS